MVTIELRDPHWLPGVVPERDLCAHGGVDARANDLVLSPRDDSSLCVSAAALYLLRTLTADHMKDVPIGPPDQSLIPCCGQSMVDTGGGGVVIIGCPYGVDWEVQHRGDAVSLRTQHGHEVTVPFVEWRAAVVSFADAVEAFYAASAPKQFHDDVDAAGYAAFWAEFRRRLDAGS